MSRNSTKSSDVTTSTEAPAEVPAYDVEMVAAYKAASDAKSRAAVRKAAEQARDEAIKALDLAKAQVYLATLDALKVDSAKAEKVELPVHVILARRAAVLSKAATMILNGTLPDGITLPEDFDTDLLVSTYGELVNAEEADEEIVALATKLAGTKVTRSVDTHDVAEFIVRAFAGDEVGTVKRISEVRRDGRIEGDSYAPSTGALRSNMEGAKAPSGFSLIPADGDQPWSIRFDGE